MAEPDRPDQPETKAPAAAGLRRRWLVNAGLLLLIAALVGLALQRMGQGPSEGGPPLTELSPDAVTHIYVEQPDRPAIILEKKAGAWRMAEPVRARTNSFNVEALLRLLTAPTDNRFPVQKQELTQYGLARPQVIVHIDGYSIAFGAPHPLNNRVYVRYQNEVALIPGQHLGAAAYPYPHYIDTALFENDRKLTAIRLPDFNMIQKDGVWQRQPPDPDLTSDRINAFAAEWHNARALNVEKYSGKESLERIDIASERDGRQEKLALDVLGFKPNFILHRPDEQLEYHFTEEAGRRLLTLPADEK